MQLTPRTSRAAGLVTGLLLAAFLLATWRVEEPATAPPGATLKLAAKVPAELGGPVERLVIETSDLRPGGMAAAGRLRLRNESGQSLQVTVRVRGHADRFDELASLRVTAGSSELARARMSALRNEPRESLVLDPRGRATVHLRAWLPAGEGDGYEARAADRTLEFVATPVGAGR